MWTSVIIIKNINVKLPLVQHVAMEIVKQMLYPKNNFSIYRNCFKLFYLLISHFANFSTTWILRLPFGIASRHINVKTGKKTLYTFQFVLKQQIV